MNPDLRQLLCGNINGSSVRISGVWGAATSSEGGQRLGLVVRYENSRRRMGEAGKGCGMIGWGGGMVADEGNREMDG